MSIQIKRGMKKDLPQLKDGELVFCKDTKELFVGSNGNENVSVTKKIEDRLDAVDSQLEHIKKKVLIVTPEEFGALGDGVNDDREPIQKALNFLKSNGGGSLELNSGKTYLLNSFTDNDGKNILLVYSNIKIVGYGTLKIADNFGDYKTIFNQAELLNNFEINGLIVDENTRTNKWLTTSGNNLTHRSTIFFYGGINNITLKNINIKDCIGIWQISLHGNKGVIDNIIIDYGEDVNNIDRTSLYNSISNSIVRNCVFNGSNISRTALESHEHNQTYINNKVKNYDIGLYIQNEQTLISSVIVCNNIFEVKKEGISLWLSENNDIPIKDLIIKNNTLIYKNDTAHTMGLISTYPNFGSSIIDNIVISDNILINSSGVVKNDVCIEFRGAGNITVNTFTISNNTLVGNFDVAINVSDLSDNVNPVNIGFLNICNNIINNKLDLSAIFRSIVRSKFYNIQLLNNSCNNTNYIANFYGSSDELNITVGYNSYTKLIDAHITKANEIVKDINNKDLINEITSPYAPYVGQWVKGQIVYNSNPTPGNYLGWVCIKGGNTYNGESIIFKGFGLIEN